MADISKITIESGTYDIKDEIARNQLNTLIPPKAFKNKKYLLVGDSYAVGYQGSGVSNIEGYYDKVVDELDLTAQIVCNNGYGFIGMSSGLTWINLLENATITNKDEITDIIICGGMNDRNTDENIETAMLNTFNYINTEFPNAIIHIGCVGRYAKNSSAQNIANQRRIAELYRIISLKYGNKYIDNSEVLLHNMSYFINDDIHPNTYGQNQLAYGLTQYIVNGAINDIKNINDLNGFQTDTIQPENNIDLSRFNMYSWTNDKITTVSINGAITFTNAITLTNITDIKIGQITNSYLCGSAFNQGLTDLIEGYVYSNDLYNGSHFVKVTFKIQNDEHNYLWLNPFTVSDDGGVKELEITEINFPYGVVSFNVDSRMC